MCFLKTVKNDLQRYSRQPFICPVKFQPPTINTGAKGYWDFRISDVVKNPDGTDI